METRTEGTGARETSPGLRMLRYTACMGKRVRPRTYTGYRKDQNGVMWRYSYDPREKIVMERTKVRRKDPDYPLAVRLVEGLDDAEDEDEKEVTVPRQRADTEPETVAEEPSINVPPDTELSGMWETADLVGGQTDVYGETLRSMGLEGL